MDSEEDIWQHYVFLNSTTPGSLQWRLISVVPQIISNSPFVEQLFFEANNEERSKLCLMYCLFYTLAITDVSQL